jgi:hypothetical protein
MIPHTEWERLALLKELECGDKVLIPTSLEHAKFMLMVAEAYIKQDQERMMNYLKKDHTK